MTEDEKKTIEEAGWTCAHPRFARHGPEAFQCVGRPGRKDGLCEGCKFRRASGSTPGADTTDSAGPSERRHERHVMKFPEWIKTMDDFYAYLNRCAEVAEEQSGKWNGIAIQWKACDIPDVIEQLRRLAEVS